MLTPNPQLLHYNYKKFLWADVGRNGSAGDAQVFNSSELAEAIEDGSIGFPDPEPLANDDGAFDIPYFLVGDDAFAQRTWLMKPYSKSNLWRNWKGKSMSLGFQWDIFHKLSMFWP